MASMAFSAISLASSAMRSLQASGGNPFEHDAPPDNSCELTPYGCLNDFYCNPAYGLADAGYNYCYVQSAYGKLAIVQTDQLSWLYSHGSSGAKAASIAFQWLAFATAVIGLMFYAWDTWKATTGWEEVYVCTIELIKVLIEIFKEFEIPCSLYLPTGNWVLWLRYAEWLLTCPVILIHLSNITGLKDDYNKRTMRLLVSDIGCIVWGVTSAMTVGYLKWIFFAIGLLYGSNTYFHSAKVYIEAYHTVPKGRCRVIVRLMAYCFYLAWTMFPILFALGPEGMGQMSAYMSTILTTIADVLSKQIWGLLGHHLRVKIYQHILIHGDIRKKTTMQVGGEDVEVEEFVDEDDEEGVRQANTQLANRESFVHMAEQMKKNGIEVRATYDTGVDKEMGHHHVEAGRIILAVPDMSMVDFFRQQLSQMPAPIELVPALGIDNTVQLVQQAAALGGCDFVLVHPEFLKDASSSGLVTKLRMMGQRVCAFGWSPMGPQRELIESRGLDGWLEGPSFGSGIDRHQLTALVSRMQMMRKATMGSGMANPMAQQQQSFMMHQQNSAHNSFMIQPQTQPQANPLYGAQMGSQMGATTGSALFHPAAPGNATPPSPSGAANVNEAEMLQQLMGEITRLKSELGGSGTPR
uniref:Channelopsin 2 n=1 Tax=Chlamydomonas raudensis TaxID=284013 RepID=G8HK99_9CHLO|nr:channelopsin 2 [Chlamydomonas raudensis]